jgi:hypothetical protein
MDLNIRDFPDDVHSGLKSEAALQKTMPFNRSGNTLF